MQLAPSPHIQRVHQSDVDSTHDLASANECTGLHERAREALRQTGYSALTRIEVSVLTGVVLLKGSVTSYHMKQLAQETIQQVFSDRIIRNELEVNTQSETRRER